MLILDALFRAIENHGFSIRIEKNRANLYRENIRMPISMSEHYKRFEYTEEESKRNWGHRYYYEPYGVLSIEDRLTTIVVEIITSFDLMRQAKEKERAEELRQAELRQQAEDRRMRRLEERCRRRDLLRVIRIRERSMRVEKFLAEFERLEVENPDALDSASKFLKWASEQSVQMKEEADCHLRALVDVVDKDIVRFESSYSPFSPRSKHWGAG